VGKPRWWAKSGVLRIAPVMFALAIPAAAQQTQPLPDAPAPASSAAPKSAGSTAGPNSPQATNPTNDRILWTLPNYLTVENADHVAPLTVKGKFKITAKDCFDPVEFPFTAVLAGIGQAQDSEPSYGQGLKGYGKRFAQSFADNTLGNFVTEAAFPSMLRQDPRYFRMGEGGFVRRTGYVLSRLVMTRGDSGQSQFNFSEIGGNAVAAEISLAYHPAADRHVSNALGVWGTQIVWDGIANELKEFWPDMHRKMSHKKDTQ
jgi:hypothetical protein